MELQGGSSTSCPSASEGQHQHLVPSSHQTDCPGVKAAPAVRAHETEVREEAAVCNGQQLEVVWSIQPFTDEEARNRDYTLDEGCPGYRHGSPILMAVMCTGESIYANFPGFCGPHELPANTKPVAIGWRYMSASPAAHCSTCFYTINGHQQRLRPIVHAPEVPPGGQVTVIPFKVFPGYIVLMVLRGDPLKTLYNSACPLSKIDLRAPSFEACDREHPRKRVGDWRDELHKDPQCFWSGPG